MRITLLVAAVAMLALAPLVMAQQKIEPIKTVEIGKNAELRVNDKPFLPLMIWLLGDSRIPECKEIAINTFSANSSNLSDKEFLNKLGENGFYGIISAGGKGAAEVVGNPYLLGWIQGDEPDMDRKKQEGGKTIYVPKTSETELAEVFKKTKELDKQRPVFMTFTGNFLKSFTGRYTQADKDRIYPAYVKFCDVVGFDIYPVYGSATPGRLCDVGIATAELKAIAGPAKPVYAWIETSKGSKWVTASKQIDVLPMHTRSEVWMALIRGATGIGYFTHSWTLKPGTGEGGQAKAYTQNSFSPNAEMRKELFRLDTQIARLAPALLAAPAKTKITMKIAAADSADLACHFKATELDGNVYIFSENIDLGPNAEKLKQFDPIAPRTGKATFTVAGLKAGTKIEVDNESRSLSAEDGRFSDEFAPLIEHVYKFKL